MQTGRLWDLSSLECKQHHYHPVSPNKPAQEHNGIHGPGIHGLYSYGVVLMRLLTNKSPLGLPHVVEAAIREGTLPDLIDTSAGEWPTEYTEELARLALRCCRYERKERPNLANEAWGILQAMMNCPDDKCKPPTFFICPMTQVS